MPTPITMPDGTPYEIPDDFTDDEYVRLAEIIRMQENDISANKPQPAGPVESTLRSLGTGVMKGVDSLVGAMRRNAGGDVLDQLTGQQAPSIEPQISAFHDPVRLPKMVDVGLQGVGATLPSGVVSPGGLLSGGMSAIGSEKAAETLGDNPLVRGLGGLAGGLTAGGLGGAARLGAKKLIPNTRTLAREAVAINSKEELAKAKAFMEAARKQNVEVDLAQALDAVGANSGRVASMRDVLASSAQGKNTQTLLGNQPQEVEALTKGTMAGLPGKNFGMQRASDNLQEAATSAIQKAKDARMNAVTPLYQKAGVMTMQQRNAVSKRLQDILDNEAGLHSDARKEITDMMELLTPSGKGDTQAIAAARKAIAEAKTASQKGAAQQQLAAANAAKTTIEPLSAERFDQVLREMRSKVRGTPQTPADPKLLGNLRFVEREARKSFGEANPAIKQANDTFARLSGPVNDLKKSQVGNIMGPAGALPDKAASQAKLRGLFDYGRDPDAPKATSPIREASQLGDEFQDGFKAWVSEKINRALRPANEGASKANSQFPGQLYETLFKDKLRYQGMKDAVEAIAENNGFSPSEAKKAIKGLDSLMQIVRSTANRPTQVGNMSMKEIAGMGGSNPMSSLARTLSFIPAERAARWAEDKVFNVTLRQMDSLLTTPEGVQTLIELSTKPVMSRAALNTLATYQGTQSQMPE